MLITIILLTLCFTFCVQILAIILYLLNKSSSYYRLFLGTFFSNTVLMILLGIFAMRDPAAVRQINISFIFWVVSGFINIILVTVKIVIIRKILKRTKDPSYYDLNFFGKKVYRPEIVKKTEMAAMFLTMPLFLILGSYFVARLVNLILYGVL